MLVGLIELLKSNDFEDKLLSVLCDIKDENRYLNGIIEELLKLDENERRDKIKILLSFSRYRPKINEKLIPKIKEEIMPITIDLKQDPYYKHGLNEGLKKGIKKGLNEGIRKVALGMLKLNIDIKIVKEATGLSEEEILKLKKEI